MTPFVPGGVRQRASGRNSPSRSVVSARVYRLLILALPMVCVALTILACPSTAFANAQQQPAAPPDRVKVFLDCQDCFIDFLREEVAFVSYVRDRTEAEVHVLITSAATGAGGREYTLAFIGAARFAGADHSLKTVTTTAESEDVVRRQLANALRVGLLTYLAKDGVPSQLAVTVKLGGDAGRPTIATDRWNNWVFSLRGSASFQGEESSREQQIGAGISADRITPEWKITLGGELDHETEEFDLDEDEPVKVNRREHDFNWLIVKALGEHWSIGASGDIESSTFENIKLSTAAAPAVEYNFFPYSMYTRRQLRVLYAVGLQRNVYYEQTLFGKTEETLPSHELSVTFEQRERWGSLEVRSEWSQYLHELDKTRFEIDGQISLRLARGLSVGAEVSASRIRDQLSLPARGATDEEILLRIRRLESGYEYQFGMSLTYTFGSIFSSVVNPRFGQ